MNKSRRPHPTDAPEREPVVRAGKIAFTPRWMRVVAGDLRGQRVQYSGDPSIRPMKDRTRESAFNLLGGDMSGRLAIDLFAGTGVLGIEAVSRGATRAVLLELSRTAVMTIVENVKRLKIDRKVEVHNVDTLRWFKYLDTTTAAWQNQPWVVFCCPPYQMWKSDELDRLKSGLLELYRLSPIGSFFVAETEQDFDLAAEIPEIEWDVRSYKPAYVGVAEKFADDVAEKVSDTVAE